MKAALLGLAPDPSRPLVAVDLVVAIDPGNNSGLAAVQVEVPPALLGQAVLRNIEKRTAKGKAGPPQRLEAVQALLPPTGAYLALVEDAALGSFPSQSAAGGFVTSRTRWYDALRSDPRCLGVANYHVSSWRSSAGLSSLKKALGCTWKEAAQAWVKRWHQVDVVSHDAAEAAVMALQAAANLSAGHMTVEVVNGRCAIKLGGKPVTYLGTS